MKKLLLFSYILLGLFTLKGQNLNVARHRNFDAPTNMVSINSKSFFMEAVGSCCRDSVNMVGLANSGQTFFKKKFTFDDFYWCTPKKVIKTKDNCIFAFGRGIGACDIMSKMDFIIKVDTTGATVFQNTIAPVSANTNNLINDATQHPDSSYYFIPENSSLIFHYSKAGQSINTLSTSITNMRSITALANGNLLINGKIGGVLKNIELSTSNSIVNQQNTGDTIVKYIQSPSGILYGLTLNGAIQTFSSDLQPINNSTVSFAAVNKITDFYLRNDSVFCTGMQFPLKTAFYAVFNSSLGLIYSHQSAYKNVYPTGITLNNKNRINIITFGTSAYHISMPFSSLYQTSMTGSLVSKYDVGVTGYSVIASTVFFHPGGGYLMDVNLAVQVKNFTNDTIKSFYLNHYSQTLFCPSLLHKQYTNTILPNGVATVTTGLFFSKEISIPGGIKPNTTYTQNVCVTSSVPNFENDIEINNDGWCGIVSVTTPVGISENNLNAYCTIYPNPVIDKLTVEFEPNTIARLRILNCLGETVFYLKEPRSEIDLSTLPSGIYFLQLHNDNSLIGTKKIIKE